ncbi:MAG: FAD-binding oxidoreductase, partial [Alphaproteobacteria bacterium]|nr:FAD-binding oxidoreductase [Alphaproteobacteria bacterium]
MDVSQTLWARLAPAGPRTEPLRGEERADIAVIGAGYTGLSAALHLAEAGVSVRVLEANQIGSGASGRNNGQVIPTLTRHDPRAIRAFLGEPWAERFVKLLVGSADLVFGLIRRHGIDCDAVQTGWIQPAHSPGRAELARRRAEQWHDAGAPAAFLDRDELAAMVGARGYHGGWINRSGGHVNPLALARGLAGAAMKAGARIHEF